jgi:hypothetical protein
VKFPLMRPQIIIPTREGTVKYFFVQFIHFGWASPFKISTMYQPTFVVKNIKSQLFSERVKAIGIIKASVSSTKFAMLVNPFV